MSKGPNQLAKEKAIQAINAALKEYMEEGYVQPPTGDVNSGNCHEALTRFQVIQAATVMVMHLNLESGSAGDVDLYKVNQAYLLDPEMRKQINALLKSWR